jgi:hypothetical protein
MIGVCQLKCGIHRVRIRQLVRKAGRHPTPDELIEIARKRQRITLRLSDFHITANRLLGSKAVSTILGKHDILNEDGYVSDDTRPLEDRGLPSIMSEIENTALAFPSAVQENPTAALRDLRDRECRLRRAKANDTLAHVRETLSGLSYQYINKIRQAKTGREHLRAFSGIKILSREVSFYQQVYNRNARVLGTLDPSLTSRYPKLRRSDCGINTAIADVNARGQSQARLPWLWAAQDGWEGDDQAAKNSMLDNDRLLECKFNISLQLNVFPHSCLVYRVNWMRARAHAHRWEEELLKTEKEMIWTTRYFMHQRDTWYGRLVALREQGVAQKGHEAYCEQMISQWEEFARLAEFQFRRANSDFPDTWVPIVPSHK